MVLVTLTSEGQTSFRKLPPSVREGYDQLLMQFIEARRLTLPGEWNCHQLEGGRQLWTLKLGPYRGIFRWDGFEARFVRFGHFTTVYTRLPK